MSPRDILDCEKVNMKISLEIKVCPVDVFAISVCVLLSAVRECSAPSSEPAHCGACDRPCHL